MTEVTIRQYQSSDLSDLMVAWEEASKLAHPFMTEAFFEQERYNIPNVYIPNADTWVVVSENKVVGFIALLGNEVGGLFVHPDFHGRRFGKALMYKAQELHGNLVVQVSKRNPIGRRFYDRYGFKQIEETVFEPTGDIHLRMAFTAE